MIKKYIVIFIFCILTIPLLRAQDIEGNKKDSKKQIDRTLDEGVFSSIDINQINLWFSNTGIGAYDPQTKGPGCYFPKYTSMSIVFKDGPILGGKVGNEIRVVGSTEKTSFQAGAIINGRAEIPSNPKYRIYKIRKDWKSLPNSLEKDQYQKDYDSWPIDAGAPWEYDTSGIKVPKFFGDMQAWWIMNDLDSIKCAQFYGSKPIGTEWQCLIWAIRYRDAFETTIFRKFKIINKGIYDLKDCYLSWWGNINIADSTDDFCGCDTALSIGYVYNSHAWDSYFGYESPVVGYNIIQGPIISSMDPYDFAYWDFGRRKGFKNLHLTAFSYSVGDQNSGYCYCDPDYPDLEGGIQLYNLQKGLRKNGRPWINPLTKLPTRFIFPGNPVTEKGWIDGPTNNPLLKPNDKRILLSCGPFNFMKNDTQEIVVSLVVGTGNDRITNIDVMKNNCITVKKAYYNNFQTMSSPQNPGFTIAQLSNKIVLYWGQYEERYTETESYNNTGYKFEGYNVYQVDPKKYSKDGAIRLATFDLVNGITVIKEQEINPDLGVVISKPVQIGSDSGIKRYFVVDKDYVNNRPLLNGQYYYFAVTAYCYNPDPSATPRSIESPLDIQWSVPQVLPIGYRNSSIVGEIIPVQKEGISDGSVIPMVIDPNRTNGHRYEVNFDTAGQLVNNKWKVQTFWTITNKLTGKNVAKSFNQSGDDNYPIFDGLFVKVIDRNNTNSKDVKFTFIAPAPLNYSVDQVKSDVDKITVFPNPYYGFQMLELNRVRRFVTFSHLPTKATLKIFTLSGTLIRTLQKDYSEPYLEWDLLNENKLFVASGIYIIYIDMPEIRAKKILKLAIIMESQILDRI